VYIEKKEYVDIESRGPYILKEEFEQALRELNDKKAAGMDKIPAKIVKNLDETQKTPYLIYSLKLMNMVKSLLILLIVKQSSYQKKATQLSVQITEHLLCYHTRPRYC